MLVPMNAQVGGATVHEFVEAPYRSGDAVRGVLEYWTDDLALNPDKTLVAAANVGGLAAQGFDGLRSIRAVPMSAAVESDDSARVSMLLNDVTPRRGEAAFAKGLLALRSGCFFEYDPDSGLYILRFPVLSMGWAVRAAVAISEVRLPPKEMGYPSTFHPEAGEDGR